MVAGIFLRRAEKVYAGGVARGGPSVKCSICHTWGCRSTCPFQHSSRNIPAHVVSHLEASYWTGSVSLFSGSYSSVPSAIILT